MSGTTTGSAKRKSSQVKPRLGRSKVPAFKCDWGILDVKAGRRALEAYLGKGQFKVAATAEIIVSYASSRDDGVSIEFACDVLSLKSIRAIPSSKSEAGQ